MPKVKEILSANFKKEQIDFDPEPEKIIARGATYIAYLKANPRLSSVKKQLRFRQLYEPVKTEDDHPFLFGFSGSRKWRHTIIKVDRDELAIHQIVD